MRAVIDTNVLLDCFYWKNPEVEPVFERICSGELCPLRSEAVLREFAEVLGRPAFGLDDSRLESALQSWCALSVPVDETGLEQVEAALTVRCRDPLDQKFFTLAVAGRARLLISRDKLVLKAGKKLRRFRVAVLAPKDFEAAFSALVEAASQPL